MFFNIQFVKLIESFRHFYGYYLKKLLSAFRVQLSQIMDFTSQKPNSKQLVLITFIIVFIAISFETAQQLYYIRKFNLAQNVTFLIIFKTQTYSWLVWLLFSYALVLYAKKKAEEDNSLKQFYKYGIFILCLVSVNLIIVSIIQMIVSEANFSLSELFTEFLPFYTYQKGPIYTLGYIALSIILHFYYVNELLLVEVLQLNQLKDINEKLHTKLSKSFSSKSSFLNIRIGNKQKIIPIDDIYWVEADDYCVKVHTSKNSAYTMRISLKHLEEKLSGNFLRVHRGAIVNMKQVEEFQHNGMSQLILKDQTPVVVSKSKIKSVREFLSHS